MDYRSALEYCNKKELPVTKFVLIGFGRIAGFCRKCADGHHWFFDPPGLAEWVQRNLDERQSRRYFTTVEIAERRGLTVNWVEFFVKKVGLAVRRDILIDTLKKKRVRVVSLEAFDAAFTIYNGGENGKNGVENG